MANVNLMAIFCVCIAVAPEGTLFEVNFATDWRHPNANGQEHPIEHR
jgi:inner membrane protein involved in colicin E2 resistance